MAHATEAQLTAWLSGGELAAPTGAKAAHLLARASSHIDRYVLSGYPTDEAGLPTEPEVSDALRDATCAQVEQWLSVGEDNDIDGYDHHTSVGAGGVNVAKRPARLAPRARDILRDAGLLWTRAW